MAKKKGPVLWLPKGAFVMPVLPRTLKVDPLLAALLHTMSFLEFSDDGTVDPDWVDLLYARAHEDAASPRGGDRLADRQSRQVADDVLDDAACGACASHSGRHLASAASVRAPARV